MNQIFRKLFATNCIVFLSFCFLVASLLNLPSSSYLKIILLGTFSAFILSLIVERLFLNRIKQLQKVTEDMTQGDFSSRLAITGQDEFGVLASSLNQVSADLQNKIMEMMQDKNELRAILACMVEGVIVIDKDERIVLFNMPIYEMLDLRSMETLGKPYWEVVRNGEINTLIKEAPGSPPDLRACPGDVPSGRAATRQWKRAAPPSRTAPGRMARCPRVAAPG